MLSILALALLAQEPQQKPERELRPAQDVPESMTQEQALASLERSLAFITTSQNPDGSWCGSAPDSVMELGFNPETYYTWQLAAVELTLMSLMQLWQIRNVGVPSLSSCSNTGPSSWQ